MALNMRTIKDENETRALAKARVEYGTNFVILGGKNIPVKSFNIFGKKKTEYELRILLIDSIYESKRTSAVKSPISTVDNNNLIKPDSLESERFIPQKQVAPISSNEMADRLVAITKLAKDSLRERAHNEHTVSESVSALENTTNVATLTQVYNNTSPNVVPVENRVNILSDATLSTSMQEKIKSMEAIRERNNEIDRKVEELVESKVKSLIDEYLSKRIESNNSIKTAELKEVSNTQLADYENYIKHDNKIVSSVQREYNRESSLDNNRENSIDYDNNDRRDFHKHLATDRVIENNSIVKKERIIKQNKNTNDECAIESYLQYLKDRDFPKEIITDIKEYLNTSSNARFYQSTDVCRSEGIKYIEERLSLSDGIDVLNSKKKIIVLLGPTGVGKTTTLPKIAANYIKSGKKVSFVTIDNYRIGAVDQLQSYASIMRVPFKSVNSPDSLRTEVRNMDMNSILFVDTTGRSPKASEDIVALSKYFATVGRFDIDIQLVMSATVKYNDASNIINSFKPTNYKGVILTKTDETDYLASSVCAIMKAGIPITYATFGQKVPKDIATGLKYKNKIIEGLYGLTL